MILLAPAGEMMVYLHIWGSDYVLVGADYVAPDYFPGINKPLDRYATRMYSAYQRGRPPDDNWKVSNTTEVYAGDIDILAGLWPTSGAPVLSAASVGFPVPIKIMWDLRVYHPDTSEDLYSDKEGFIQNYASWQLLDSLSQVGEDDTWTIENIRFIWPATEV